MRNPCRECLYYIEEHNICRSKRDDGVSDGYVTMVDRMFCVPYKNTQQNENPTNS